jgi:hypothetical protein
MTSVRYLDAVRVSLALLLINLVIALFALALGFGVHSLPCTMSLIRAFTTWRCIAIGCLGLSGMFCITLWHDVARCSVGPARPIMASKHFALRPRRALHRGIYRPYAALACMLGMLAFGAVAARVRSIRAKPAASIASQQVLLLGTSLCRVARLQRHTNQCRFESLASCANRNTPRTH